MNPKIAVTSIAIEKALLRKLKKQASADGLSVSAFLRYHLRKILAGTPPTG